MHFIQKNQVLGQAQQVSNFNKTLSLIKSKYLLIPIIIIIFSLVLIFYISKYRKKEENVSISNLSYGTKVQDYYIKDNEGKVLKSPSLLGKIKLFLFFSPKENIGPLKYADTLYQRYKTENFLVFSIYSKKINLRKISPDLEDICCFVAHDKDNSLHKKFMVPSHQSMTFFLDGEDIVRFVETRLIEERLMRLLVEKFVHKSTEERKFLEIGERIPDLTVWDISRKEKYLMNDIKDKRILFLATDCSPCNIEKYFRTIKRYEDEQGENKRFLSIFSRNFLLKELSELKKRYKIYSPIYLLRGEIIIDMPVLIWIDDQAIIYSIDQLDGI